MRPLLILSALLAFGQLHAQKAFPRIEGQTAEGRTVVLPEAAPRKYTLIGMAYGQKAQPLLEDWYEPAYLRFVAKHGLFAGLYDVRVFFVPLFVGANKAAYEPSLAKFRRSASPEVVDLVVFAKAELELLQAELDMTDKALPYIFVLDEQGRIVHRTQGGFTEEKLEAIEELLLQ